MKHIGVGQQYEVNEFGTYLLAQVAKRQVCLIGLESANRLNDMVTVHDVFNITEAEFSLILGEQTARLL